MLFQTVCIKDCIILSFTVYSNQPLKTSQAAEATRAIKPAQSELVAMEGAGPSWSDSGGLDALRFVLRLDTAEAAEDDDGDDSAADALELLTRPAVSAGVGPSCARRRARAISDSSSFMSCSPSINSGVEITPSMVVNRSCEL